MNHPTRRSLLRGALAGTMLALGVIYRTPAMERILERFS